MKTPIAPPIALRHHEKPPCTARPSSRNLNAKDSPQRASYLTASRLAALSAGLSERDWQLLGFVAELRLITSRQLMRRFWAAREVDPAAARTGRSVLRRLTALRVLTRLPRRIGGVRAGSDGFVYGVGPAGVKLLRSRGFVLRRTYLPGDRHLDHTLAIAEVVVTLYEAHGAGTLEVIEVQTEPRCHRSFLVGLGSTLTLKPDLFVRIGLGAYEDRYFVEIDRSTEAGNTITAKAERYYAHYRSGSDQSADGVYPAVLWVVLDAARQRQLEELLRLAPGPDRMHSVCSQDALVDQLAAEASS
jgi:hypothetical protein